MTASAGDIVARRNRREVLRRLISRARLTRCAVALAQRAVDPGALPVAPAKIAGKEKARVTSLPSFVRASRMMAQGKGANREIRVPRKRCAGLGGGSRL